MSFLEIETKTINNRQNRSTFSMGPTVGMMEDTVHLFRVVNCISVVNQCVEIGVAYCVLDSTKYYDLVGMR